MRRQHSSFGNAFFAISLVIAATPGVSHATMIAVYSRPGDILHPEEAVALANALRQNPAALVAKQFTVRMADSSVLSPEFSVPPGVAAYFWSDQPFVLRGFAMKGIQSTFERAASPSVEDTAKTNVLNETAVTGIAVPTSWTNEFQGASLDSKRIQLRYTLSGPGRVSVEIYGMNGRNYERGAWEEASSGPYERFIDLNMATQGPVLVRWRCGEKQVTRRITGF